MTARFSNQLRIGDEPVEIVEQALNADPGQMIRQARDVGRGARRAFRKRVGDSGLIA
jgi:hypothetical protein